MKMRKLMRVAAVITTGGMLLQSAGCATSWAPLALSVLENIVLAQFAAGVGGSIF